MIFFNTLAVYLKIRTINRENKIEISKEETQTQDESETADLWICWKWSLHNLWIIFPITKPRQNIDVFMPLVSFLPVDCRWTVQKLKWTLFLAKSFCQKHQGLFTLIKNIASLGKTVHWWSRKVNDHRKYTIMKSTRSEIRDPRSDSGCQINTILRG